MRLSPARLLEERPGTLLAALTLLALALRLTLLAKMHDAKPEKGCRRTLRLCTWLLARRQPAILGQ